MLRPIGAAGAVLLMLVTVMAAAAETAAAAITPRVRSVTATTGPRAASATAPAVSPAPDTQLLGVGAEWSKPDGVHAVVGLYGSATLTLTLTDASASQPLYDVGLTTAIASASAGSGAEFYPAGAVTFSDCGPNPRMRSTNHGSSVRLTGITIDPSAAPPTSATCTIIAQLLGTRPGTVRESLSSISYATAPGGSPTSVAAPTGNHTLQVLRDPRIDVSIPGNGAVYAYGSSVRASYGCSQRGAGSSWAIIECLGYDDFQHEIDPGSYLDTLAPGERTLQVNSVNLGSGFSQRVIDYAVALPRLEAIRSPARRPLRYSIHLPFAGTLRSVALYGGRVVAELATQVSRGGTVRPQLRLDPLGRRLLAAVRRRDQRRRRAWERHHRHHSHRRHWPVPALVVTLRVSYAPSASAIVANPNFTLFSGRPVSSTRHRVRFR